MSEIQVPSEFVNREGVKELLVVLAGTINELDEQKVISDSAARTLRFALKFVLTQIEKM